MSEDQDDRTELPTARALARAFDEGKIAMGRDAPAVAGVAAGLACLMWAGPLLVASVVDLLHGAAQSISTGATAFPQPLLYKPAALGFGVLCASASGAAIATVVQTRGGAWLELVEFDPSRLFSMQRLLKMASRQFWVDMLASVLKLGVLMLVAWRVGAPVAKALPSLLSSSSETLLASMGDALERVLMPVLAAAALLSVGDYLLARHRFLAGLKMTKSDIKRESKEDDGDPLLRQKRKRRHRELAAGRPQVAVPMADAVLVNPTHLAVAIRYQRDKDKAPRITAKGKGLAAENIRQLAREHGIPIVQDIPLARLLHKRVKVGQTIPADTYRAVAAILAFVYRTTGRAAGSRGAA